MKTILLIDDDAAARRAIKDILNTEGWKVMETADPAQGLQWARAQRPQVVVVDFLLPRGQGIQICRQLRADPHFENPVLVITSARDFPHDREKALEVGGQHFLPKPFDPIRLKKLFDRLAVAEEGAAASTPTVLPDNEPTRLKFWGVRGSIPSPGPETVRYGGNTTCAEVRAEGQLIILDAGSGIRPLGLALAKEFKGKPLEMTLLITHTHWDHIQGFPFFIPAYNQANTVNVLGYEGATRSLQETLAGQMESPYFPVGLKEMPGNLRFTELRELNFNVGRIRVQAMYVNHPGICVAYRLFTRDGSITFMPDIEHYSRLKTRMPGGTATPQESQAFAEHQEQRLREFIRHSDVLILDSQYDAEEYESHVGWGHSCVDDSVLLALRAGVKHLYLFHHDPTHSDKKLDSMTRHARQLVKQQGGKLAVTAAREGLEIVLHQTVRKRPRKSPD